MVALRQENDILKQQVSELNFSESPRSETSSNVGLPSSFPPPYTTAPLPVPLTPASAPIHVPVHTLSPHVPPQFYGTSVPTSPYVNSGTPIRYIVPKTQEFTLVPPPLFTGNAEGQNPPENDEEKVVSY